MSSAGNTSSAPTGHLPLKGKARAPQTPEELERECLGTIARAAQDMERCAMEMDVAGLRVHFDFVKAQMNRLDVIRTTVRQTPRVL